MKETKMRWLGRRSRQLYKYLTVATITIATLMTMQSCASGSPLRKAVASDNIGEATRLLETGAKADNESLVEACEKNNVEMVKLLIKKGADINGEVGNSFSGRRIPLTAASSLEVMTELLSAGAEINSTKATRTALATAMGRENWQELATYLIKKGALVNQRYENGNCYDSMLLNARVKAGFDNTALFYVICAYKTEAGQVEFLVSLGADPNIVNQDGFSAMKFASERYRIGKNQNDGEILNALKKKRKMPELQKSTPKTPGDKQRVAQCESMYKKHAKTYLTTYKKTGEWSAVAKDACTSTCASEQMRKGVPGDDARTACADPCNTCGDEIQQWK